MFRSLLCTTTMCHYYPMLELDSQRIVHAVLQIGYCTERRQEVFASRRVTQVRKHQDTLVNGTELVNSYLVAHKRITKGQSILVSVSIGQSAQDAALRFPFTSSLSSAALASEGNALQSFSSPRAKLHHVPCWMGILNLGCTLLAHCSFQLTGLDLGTDHLKAVCTVFQCKRYWVQLTAQNFLNGHLLLR